VCPLYWLHRSVFLAGNKQKEEEEKEKTLSPCPSPSMGRGEASARLLPIEGEMSEGQKGSFYIIYLYHY
jgi:hypothetical protein